MDKIWVKDVKEGEKIKSVFLVARKATPTAKSGKTYLAATFTDKTGELEARAFDKLEELGAFEEKDYVEVEGQIGTFQGKPQLRLETVSKADAAALDAAEFTWVAPPEPKKPERPAAEPEEGPWQELLVLVEAVTDQHVKALIAAFLGDEDFAARFRRAAAAKTVHHAYPGGLLEHTISTIKLAHRLADHYPQVDRDLLVAGAFFHDIGKVRELTTERQAEYTDEGKLVGHLVMSAQWIHDKARRVGMPRELEHHIVHIVLSHHGQLEYGSPKIPMTLEALLTHYLDEIDSRVNSWLNLMGKDGGGNRRWTDTNNVYEQSIWRGALPTVQAEKKGPPAEALTPVIYVPREGGGQGGQQPRKNKEKKPRPTPGPRPERPERADRPERPERRAESPAAPAEAGAPAAEGATAAVAPPAPRREGRPDRGMDRGGGHRGGPGSFGGPGDKKKGYTGPRLPGDKGPQRPPPDRGLKHNPFAALAAKLEDGAAKPVEAAPADATAPAAEPAPAPAPEAPPPAAPEAPPSGEGQP